MLADIIDADDFETFDGIPLLIPQGASSTHSGFDDILKDNERAKSAKIDIDAFIDGMIVPTCGNLFHGVKLRDRLPIPDFPRMRRGVTLDIGCNWGRWSIAGALAGHTMVAMDIHLESLLVAREIAQRLVPHNMPLFVLGDARSLPFKTVSLENVFSYSVIQHFSRENAALILSETGRVLRAGGKAVVQMPNAGGLKARMTGKSANEAGEQFDVRYYSIENLLDLFKQHIGPSEWLVDCFLGLNVHAKDVALLPLSKKPVVYAAEMLKALSWAIPPFARLSDSVWVQARKSPVWIRSYSGIRQTPATSL